MAKFAQYNIPLKSSSADSQTFYFVLDDCYFKKIDSPEVQRGNVTATVIVNKKPTLFELSFDLNGMVQIPCDRCLDDMEQPIQHKDHLQVKFGDSFSEEGDIVVVPENEGVINIAWFLYEFIVLNIPIKHVHTPGQCNKMMVGKLKKYITRQKSDDDDSIDDVDFSDDDADEITTDEVPTDPRWDGLQNILDNN